MASGAGSYVVVLGEGVAATTDGEGTQGTQARDDALVGAERQQDAVLQTVAAEPTHRYGTVLNGFSATLTAGEVAALGSDPRVRSVTPVRLFELDSAPSAALPTTDRSPAALGLSGSTGLWAQVGGAGVAGRGQVIGVVDTGLDHANPSFGASGVAVPPSDWDGVCQRGQDASDWPSSACDSKVIGARIFSAGLADYGLRIAEGESRSPADTDGHGTHVAGTAAGRSRPTTGGTTITGVAPLAHLAVYKACWWSTGPGSSARPAPRTT